MWKIILLFLLFLTVPCYAQFIEDEWHGDAVVTGSESAGVIQSASGFLGTLHLSLPDISVSTHDPNYVPGVRIMAASDVSDPTPTINWYTFKLINDASVWVMDDTVIEAFTEIFPITISSASCGVIAVHPTLPGYLTISKVIGVELGGIDIPPEQCPPVSTVSSATRYDAIRIYQRWCWFTPPTDAGKSRGYAHVEIGYATP